MLLPLNPNAFARSPLDRAGHHRRDSAWIDAALANDRTMVAAFNSLRPLVYESGQELLVRWLGGNVVGELGQAEPPPLFLGVDKDGAAHFACEIIDAEALRDFGQFTDLRGAGPRLAADQIAILGCAKAVFEWHEKNQFCANCGARSQSAEAGWKRVCPQCQREHFPRVDPVVIMLPTLGDRCLLGRQPMWPKGMHSALAGFIEPGEAIEDAVARETLEEAGLVVREVRLHSTQPWPFPHSLMIGAICDVENEDIHIDQLELESARWFSREEARLLIAGKFPGAFAPPPFAIAHQLLKTWAEEG